MKKSKAHPGSDWQQCWSCLERIISQNRDGQAALSEGDFNSLVLPASLLVQSYVQALKGRVPDKADDGKYERFLPIHSETFLLNLTRQLNQILCSMARNGRSNACDELWDQATALSETFAEVAARKPELFRHKARNSIFMPSLRAKPKRETSRAGKEKWSDPFLGEVPRIAEAIELSQATIDGGLQDNRVPLGSYAARVVAECIHEIQLARNQWKKFFEDYGDPIEWPTQQQVEPFFGMRIDDILGVWEGISDEERALVIDSYDEEPVIVQHLRHFSLFRDCGVERLHFLLLPELTIEPDASKIWWKNAVEGMIEEKFPRLIENPGLAQALRSASSGTPSDMLKELKDYTGARKIRQFARAQKRP